MKALSILLLASVCAFGQSSGTGDAVPQSRSAVAGTVPDSKPLKCGKYEHYVESACIQRRITTVCDEVIPARCAPDMHEVTAKEWAELQEWRQWVDRLRREQCPSLSWVGGKCLPFCDEKGVYGSCAHRAGEDAWHAATIEIQAQK